jgi:hypothetical protein
MEKIESIIIAPHPDDEVIGCFSKLKENSIIIYDGDTEPKRREEALKLREYYPHCKQLFLKSIPSKFLDKINMILIPDPVYETHPLHRRWGALGEQLARDGQFVIFYNTTMTAPYIHEINDLKVKERVLSFVYPSQRSLWEYDKKYILFEGYCRWIF